MLQILGEHWTYAPAIGLAAVFLFTAGLALKRLYFHPLSKFPGPRLAAVTAWFEAYYDICDFGLCKRYSEWHAAYGPIIRITPNHLHVNDPNFFNEVFKTRTNYIKEPTFYDTLAVTGGIDAICDIDKHRALRNVMNPLFSKAHVSKLSPLMAERLQEAVLLIARCAEGRQPINIQQIYRRITLDLIMHGVFGISQSLESREIYPAILVHLDDVLNVVGVNKHFPMLRSITAVLPRWLMKGSEVHDYIEQHCAQRRAQAVKDQDNGVSTEMSSTTTLFDLMLQPKDDERSGLPSCQELINEAFLFILAGSDTTAYTLSCATYYLLNNQEVLTRLLEELDALPEEDDGKLEWSVLTRLPYLAAVVLESLRLSTSVPGNLPRIVPSEGAYVQGHFIPGGTIVSITNRMIHDNPDLFEDPASFNPDRFLGAQRRESEKWHISFSKGPRRCLGANLAIQEITMTLATVFKHFSMTLHETDDESMVWQDKGLAINRSHVKVLVKPRRSSSQSVAVSEGL